MITEIWALLNLNLLPKDLILHSHVEDHSLSTPDGLSVSDPKHFNELFFLHDNY